jgi:hypothetical protein
VWAVGVVVIVVLGAVAAVLVAGGSKNTASAQTVRFQKPADAGPSPFTAPSDIRGSDNVKLDQVGAGPYGGTGSDLVCDRELLISSLRARPDRLAEWARVRGIDPNPDAVAAYIRSLRPVTLTRDTRVTNYSFEDGKAVGFQSILQAGTAVLVDRYGEPVVRCRCGNPLSKPIYYREAKCLYCPPNYNPPPPCYYKPYDGSGTTTDNTYTGSTDGSSGTRKFYSNCYKDYPHPPAVRRSKAKTSTARPPPQQTQPSYPQPYDYDRQRTYSQPTYTQDTYTQHTETGCCGGGGQQTTDSSGGDFDSSGAIGTIDR